MAPLRPSCWSFVWNGDHHRFIVHYLSKRFCSCISFAFLILRISPCSLSPEQDDLCLFLSFWLFHLLLLCWFPSGFCPIGTYSFLFNQLFLSPWLCQSASYLVSSSPIFHGCVNERLADRTPSPTFSTADSDITELADEQQDEMEDFDDEAFVDDTGSDAGTEEGSDLFSDGHDPFYDRSPWFILVGRLVRLLWERQKGTSSCSKEAPCAILDDLALDSSIPDTLIWLERALRQCSWGTRSTRYSIWQCVETLHGGPVVLNCPLIFFWRRKLQRRK